MSLGQLSQCVIERLDGSINYNGTAVPLIDPQQAFEEGGTIPPLHITYPQVTAEIDNYKSGEIGYNGDVLIAAFAYAADYGEGVQHDLIELIRLRLDGWKPLQNINTFLPQTIDAPPPVDRYRSASISYQWITS